MYDRYVWSHIDGSLFIARESYLLEIKKETPKLSDKWSDAMAVRIAARDLHMLEPEGNA